MRASSSSASWGGDVISIDVRRTYRTAPWLNRDDTHLLLLIMMIIRGTEFALQKQIITNSKLEVKDLEIIGIGAQSTLGGQDIFAGKICMIN